ncbi:MAG: hypothetical protein L0K41_00920 [Yaniella sp.]|uniref:hypothetical protein n=1 Tax=Yaniella sp. TaxID=2773929 RepID=UPI002648B82E|nr:hypothetical protein [Yaniella sp.]MDN5704750.1 hypothetical protein [Yaniella sp.]MDN5731374.1 hypothetical protein [Yaniella sp.]MDN5741953.1 hypothetical protein [Yaniella sp.]MDN5817461.1 hypothetical protein [Yaniella sp.]MDN5912112.1 hypothetical protein [Yaniella sp.]
MAGFFSRPRHGRRDVRADRFDQALGIAHRWFLDQVGEVATIQYVTAPADLDWWQQDTAPPLITSGINESGVVAMTLYRKFISFKVADETLLPEMLYELLITEWASLIGQHVSDVDPNF